MVGDDDDDASTASEGNDSEKKVETTVGFGTLFGLNSHTPATTIKLSLDIDF